MINLTLVALCDFILAKNIILKTFRLHSEKNMSSLMYSCCFRNTRNKEGTLDLSFIYAAYIKLKASKKGRLLNIAQINFFVYLGVQYLCNYFTLHFSHYFDLRTRITLISIY